MKCVKCKKEIDEEDIYCGYCGINQRKFAKYINRVEEIIHKERDDEYEAKVKEAEDRLNKLKEDKINTIKTLTDERWKELCPNLLYNETEGKIKVNDQDYIFSDIKGAEIKTLDGFTTITNTTGTNNSKSEQGISLGSAIVGGLIGGGVGAVIGGVAGGDTKTKGKTNQISTSNQIPVCHHLGIIINLNGFNSEVVLSDSPIEHKSSEYITLMDKAEKSINVLRKLSTTKVPKKWTKVGDEKVVLEFDPLIEDADKNLKATIDDKPNYDIPESYYK